MPSDRIVRPLVSVTRGETCNFGFFQVNAGCTYTVMLRVVPVVNPSAATQFAFTCAFNWKNVFVTRFVPKLMDEVIVLASGNRLLWFQSRVPPADMVTVPICRLRLMFPEMSR